MAKYWRTPSGKCYNLYKDMLSNSHLLVAGCTGSGKSVLINALIYTALFKAPSEVKFIFCDSKMIELRRYRDLPHTIRYADTLEGIASALEYAHKTVMNRLRAIEKSNLTETTDNDIYVVIDGFDILVARGSNKAENKIRSICEQHTENISRLGRPAHVHLILSTQAPNRKTIRDSIILNMTAKVALLCMFPIESKQIIGVPNAVNLPDPKRTGHAEAYYLADSSLGRWEIPMIQLEDIDKRIQWWMDQKPKGIFTRLFG